MPQSDPSRTEDPTKKQLDKARDEGNVPKSQELPKAVITLVGLVTIYYLVGYISGHIKWIFSWVFEEGITFRASPVNVMELFLMLVKRLAWILLPVMFFLALAAFLVQRLQVGPLWTTKALQPKFNFLNLAGGLQKIFISPKVFINLGKNVLMAFAVGIAPYIVLKQEAANILPLFYASPEGIAIFILKLAYKMVIYALIPMIIIGLADLVYARWDYNEQLKMTKDEVKDERKQMEGDPQVKSQQRQKMMESMAQRMMEDVPKADVVITNPTHYAVALQYDAFKAPAPIVVAKGVDALALRIKEVAQENNVPIRENKPLAQALYKQVEIGEMIPEEMYQAVAAILAKIRNTRRHG
ncbi:flagellar biosynthesis protein FlhB [Desulfohalovibrio reitneri]|uniref:flagellar biosynthesis protein FlhB n=1 Tax=Desulfohalovibrio reitneri TaxID=1307759 RepID=UPI0004A75E78|nr:flagellar biosynthesis protein FlhB [Desulfohalovibrio reitneri]